MHRDIKSENVFRTGSGVWKLGDFGSSLRIGDKRALEKQVIKLEGTFSFAAPEYIAIWSAFNRTQLLDATSFKVGGDGSLCLVAQGQQQSLGCTESSCVDGCIACTLSPYMS